MRSGRRSAIAILALAAFVSAAASAEAGKRRPAKAGTEGFLPSPSGVTASGIGETSVTLTWAASTDARVTGYRVTRDGAQVGLTATTSYTLSGLSCATRYQLGVRALNALGGESSEVATEVTTSACAPPPLPPPPPPPACARYAAPAGSDAAAGTLEAPFRSVQKLVSSLTAGQTGCLRAGTYTGDVRFATSGAQGSPITLTEAAGESATVVGRLHIPDATSDVVIKDLDLNGKNASALPSPTVLGDRISFIGNDVTNEHTGICFVLGSVDGYGIAYDPVIENNRIHDCGRLPATNHDHGIYVEKSRNARIVGNVIYDNADRGIQLYPDAQGTLIERNTIDGNGQGILFSGDLGLASNDTRVIDNVITNSKLRYNLESWYPDGNPIGVANLAERNCVWHGAQGDISSQVGFVATATVVADPLYVDRVGKNFRLQAGSPCAGKGSAS